MRAEIEHRGARCFLPDGHPYRSPNVECGALEDTLIKHEVYDEQRLISEHERQVEARHLVEPRGNSRIKNYERVADIGTGSFGKAILVRDMSAVASTSRRPKLYVMKIIDIVRLGPKERRDAANEVRLLSSLKHPYIISYKESFVENGCMCIVMEYADGGDLFKAILRQKRKRQRFPESQIIRWFTQAALALKHLHDRHILHRDLKSQNMFLTLSGRLCLGDFGIAKVLGETSAFARTQIGTPYFLSPEICQNRPYSWASDIWALGCVLYELATLEVPFDAPNISVLVVKITRQPPPPLPSTYSAALRRLCADCLNREWRLRPTAAEILQRDIIKNEIRAMFLDQHRKRRLQLLARGEGVSVPRVLTPPPRCTPREKEPETRVFHRLEEGTAETSHTPRQPRWDCPLVNEGRTPRRQHRLVIRGDQDIPTSIDASSTPRTSFTAAAPDQSETACKSPIATPLTSRCCSSQVMAAAASDIFGTPEKNQGQCLQRPLSGSRESQTRGANSSVVLCSSRSPRRTTIQHSSNGLSSQSTDAGDSQGHSRYRRYENISVPNRFVTKEQRPFKIKCHPNYLEPRDDNSDNISVVSKMPVSSRSHSAKRTWCHEDLSLRQLPTPAYPDNVHNGSSPRQPCAVSGACSPQKWVAPTAKVHDYNVLSDDLTPPLHYVSPTELLHRVRHCGGRI